MAIPSYIFIYGFWDRVDNEIYKQNRTKKDIADQCGFDRKNFKQLWKYVFHISQDFVVLYMYQQIIYFQQEINTYTQFNLYRYI